MATLSAESLSITTSPEKASAEAYLTALITRTLRVTTSDGRMFLGEFKCTDSELNIILAHTYEYRFPSTSSIAKKLATTNLRSSKSSTVATTTTTNTSLDSTSDAETSSQSTVITSSSTEAGPPAGEKVTMDMTSRYLGLVVVPGEHVVKIEVEEFISQVKNGQSKWTVGDV